MVKNTDRIVLRIEPSLKKKFYERLDKYNANASEYVREFVYRLLEMSEREFAEFAVSGKRRQFEVAEEKR